MTLPRSAALAALLAAIPAVLAAQTSADARPVTVRLAAGGAVPQGGALDAFDPGWSVAGGARIRLRPGLALRLEAQYVRVTGEAFYAPGPGDDGVRIEPAMGVTALTLAAELSPGRLGAVRPYLLAGGGYHRLRALDGTDEMNVFFDHQDGTNSLGVLYGGGLETSLGRVAPFVEVRHHIVFLSADNTSFIPAVVGVRF